MDAKKKLFCILLLREFKQHVDSCFVYLSDKEEQRKQYNDYTIHHPIFFTFVIHISASYDANLVTHVPKLPFQLETAFTEISPIGQITSEPLHP